MVSDLIKCKLCLLVLHEKVQYNNIKWVLKATPALISRVHLVLSTFKACIVLVSLYIVFTWYILLNKTAHDEVTTNQLLITNTKLAQ